MFYSGGELMTFNFILLPIFAFWMIPFFGLLSVLLFTLIRLNQLENIETSIFVTRFIVVLFCFTMWGIIWERTKRGLFIQKYEALEKERAWKEIFNVIPEGVLVLRQNLQIHLVNNGLINIVDSSESLQKLMLTTLQNF